MTAQSNGRPVGALASTPTTPLAGTPTTPLAGATMPADDWDPLLRACLEAAAAAPSVHNTQPWLFRPGSGGVDLLVDRDRHLDVIDPSGRALLMSVGAALLNLRVAMLAHGRTPIVRLLPEPDEPDLMARVRTGPPVRITGTARLLARAIPRRHTNRRPYSEVAVPAEVRAELVGAAAAEGATLTMLDRGATTALLSLVRTAENRWRHNPAYWGELAHWTRPAPGRRDGVPVEAFGPYPDRESFPVRDFGLVQPTPHRGTMPFERFPLLAVLHTAGDGLREWLRAGQALERTLLTAAVRGLATSPLTQPLEIPELRQLLIDGVRFPQVIIRLGYGRPSPPSPRRFLDDVVVSPAPTRESSEDGRY